MGSRIAWPLAVTAVALTLTAGCGGKASPSPEASGAAASTLTASPAPSTTGSPTSSTPAIDPNIPAAARAHTPAGAEAFATYYFNQFNTSLMQAKPELLQPLGSTGCKTCQAFVETAAQYRQNHQHYRGEPFSVSSVGALGGQGSASTIVIVAGAQHGGAIVDASGRVVHATKYQKGQWSVHLAWRDDHWVADEIKVVR